MYVDLALDELFRLGFQENVSDIHFDSCQEGLRVRFRKDGFLEDKRIISGEEGEQMVNRIKILSGLDIAEKRLPQDGRLQLKLDNHMMTMRISTLPAIYGETVVCRILGNEGAQKTLCQLGMNVELYQRIQQLLLRPYGLFLIAGPTGSGKTSTLYSILRLVANEQTKLISLEDPVEASIKNAIQVAINEKIGFSFATGLRSVLRQDPDTIMIGEIRDVETARLAIRAALTGHKVFSTIHTNTAAGVVERLIDMGVEKYLLDATLMGAISQRLVRKVQKDGSYRGRFAIFEYLEVPINYKGQEPVGELVVKTLRDSMLEAIEQGLSTVEEGRRLGLEV